MTRHKFNRGNDGQRLYHMHCDRASCQLERQRRVQLRLCPLLLLSPPIASLRSPHQRRSFGRNTLLTIDHHIISPSPNRRRLSALLLRSAGNFTPLSYFLRYTSSPFQNSRCAFPSYTGLRGFIAEPSRNRFLLMSLWSRTGTTIHALALT